jgi:hypothetical protein
MSNTANEPARKWPRYVSWTLADTVWLLDFLKNNPRLSEDLGKTLAADFNATVKDERDKREPVKKRTIAGCKKGEAQLRKQDDDQAARAGKGKCARRTNSIQRWKRFVCVV